MIYQNNESSLILTHLKLPNLQKFLYSIIFLLVAKYLIRTHLLFISQAYSELHAKFKRVKYLMILSYIIELQKLLNKYILHLN